MMFNQSEIGLSGRERLNDMQREARQHELVKRSANRSEQDHSLLLRLISFIRTMPVRANDKSIQPETTRQTLWQAYDSTK
jgi:hypothetical protein